MDKISYALGLSLGSNLINSGITNLNFEKVSKGIKDIIENNPLEISLEEAQEEINNFFAKLQNEAGSKAQKEGEIFLAENAKREEVTTLPSGLQYEIITKGDGQVPIASNKVKVHYHGTLINGQVFDSSVQRGEPAVFGVTQVIQGWVEALQLMPVGSKWKLYIPSNLAYGERGAGQSIGPNTALIFEVELLGIEK